MLVRDPDGQLLGNVARQKGMGKASFGLFSGAPEGGTPLTLVRGFAPYPRPDPFLAGPASASTEADRLLDQARATADNPARTTLYKQSEAQVLADLTAAPLVTEHQAAVLTPGPQGFNLTPWNTLDLATVSLPA